MAASEEFTANVRCTSRIDGYRIFLSMATTYFQCATEHLDVTCYRAGVDEEIKNADGAVVRHTYELTFGAVIRSREEQSTEPTD